MRVNANKLHFISRIKRDGSGVEKCITQPKFMDNESFTVHGLSLTEGTFIAIGFNSYVVKYKPEYSRYKQ